MEDSVRFHGKIAHGLRGSGTVTPEMVEQRARELAVINGHDSFNQADFQEAKREMLGMEDTIGDSARVEPETSSEIRSEVPNVGQRVPTMSATDPQAQIEELVQGGVDEAEHDTMLKGARAPTNQE